ncbi:MAG: hypothetical protein AB1529_05770 [Candidatus Micrarchaeota archaeon]
MDRRVPLACSIIGSLLLLLPFASILMYILMPVLISALTGTPGACDAGDSNLANALSGLCSSAKSFLGITAMLTIILAPFSYLLAAVPFTIVIFGDKGLAGGEKVKWLAAIWVLPGIGAILYYAKK